MGQDYPPETILYTQLNPDNCNIQDMEFERGINRFMERYMPGFPIQLLERDWERWELEPLGDCKPVVLRSPEDGMWEVLNNCGEIVHGFDDEDEAQAFADEQNEQAEEGRLGFPWAWNWCHYPNEDITDEDLQAAGFVIGLYTDSDGEQRRLCGIDGCGYSFQGAHFSKLYAIVHHRWGRAVQTVQGPRLITFPTN